MENENSYNNKITEFDKNNNNRITTWGEEDVFTLDEFEVSEKNNK